MTTPAPTTALTVRGYMRSPQMIERFAEVVGKNNAGAYISSALLAVANNDRLQKCRPDSIAVSALRAATLRLSCDPGIGEAYLVPFKDRATLVIGYKGLRSMAIRTGKYRFLNVATIFEGQEVIEDQLTGAIRIEGKPKSERVLGRVAYFQLTNGFEKSLYMTTEEIHQHAKRYSKSYNFNDSVWQAYKVGEKDNPMEMKTPLRLLIQRWGYLDAQDRVNAGLNREEDDGEVIDAEEYDVPSPEDVTPEPEPEKPTRSQALDELMGNVNPVTTKYKTTGNTIISRIAQKSGMGADEILALLTDMTKRGEIAAEMTINDADELAKRINA